MRFLNVLGLTFLIFLVSCAVKHKASQIPEQSSLYKPGSRTNFHPEYLVFHINDSVSQLLVKLNPDELLFNQANPENKMEAVVKIYYQLTDITKEPNNKVISDSLSIFQTIEKSASKKISISTLLIKAQIGKAYLLKVVVVDVLQNIMQQNFVFVNKRNRNSAQNFKMVSRKNSAPIFKTYLKADDVIGILSNQPNVSKIYIRFQKDNTPLPPPPFSVQTERNFTFRTDSLWTFSYNPQKSFMFPYQGLYLVQTDSTQNEGLFFANYGSSYPKIKEPMQMIPPLEYLTTSEEFRNLQKVINKKIAVDNYWLNLTNNVDMARELIRIYYNRFYYANLYFTSYKEGWKTDRGMVYIIFGPPSFITKTPYSEIWEYHDRRKVSIFNITFIKAVSPFNENHYIMQRNDSYTPFWRDAVESWHSGKIYSIKD
jgi:GWxTD domain-containing protein